MFSFGPSNPSICSAVIGYFVRYPFNYIQEETTGKESFMLLILNGLFWGSIFYLLTSVIRRVAKKMKTTY
jgi:hypothetical protein